MLAQWNRDLEAGLQTLPPEAFEKWLWGVDPNAPVCATCALNEMHLLGLLIARYRARFFPQCMRVRLQQLWPLVVHGSVPVCDMSMRQIRDCAEDLQMHFADYCEGEVQTALDAIMARFGEINTMPDPPIGDDIASCDPERPGRLSLAAIRRMTALLCVLYRHLHLASVAVDIPECTEYPDVLQCHARAAVDVFQLHMMHADIPPAARLIYRQDFSGMYNSITQVVYFHYPSYERKLQPTLADIRKGLCPAHCLCVALELEPSIPVRYEDDMLSDDGFVWVLLAGGAVYAVGPPQADGSREVLSGQCLWTVMDLVLKKSLSRGDEAAGRH